MIKNSEKGVSLIITFFILAIILGVVLSISIILYSEIKIIRNIGDSVVAFYAADSGVEKTLYYDRKKAPETATGGKRGVCTMCDEDQLCPTNNSEMSLNCKCEKNEGPECTPDNCENCTITFSTTVSNNPKKTYSVKAVVSKVSAPNNELVKFSQLNIYSTGSYASVTNSNEVKRAIELDIQKDETGEYPPEVNAYVSFRTQPQGYNVTISAFINAYGHGVKSVEAHVYEPSGGYNETFTLTSPNGKNAEGDYYITLSGLPIGVYRVDITACDNRTPSNCSEVSNIPGV